VYLYSAFIAVPHTQGAQVEFSVEYWGDLESGLGVVQGH